MKATGGANVVQRPARWDIPFGGGLDAAALSRVLGSPAFSRFAAAPDLLDLLRNDTRLLTRNRGDIVFRQGEYGTSTYHVLDGELAAFRDLDPSVLGRSTAPSHSRLRGLIDLFRPPRAPETRPVRLYEQLRQARSPETSAEPVTKVLETERTFQHPSARPIREGAFFGDAEAMNRGARDRSVIATENGTSLLEIRWQGFRDLLQRVPELQAFFDQRYREALPGFLRRLPLFASLPNRAVSDLSRDVRFETHGHYDWSRIPRTSTTIVEQGDYAEEILLVRSGFAREVRGGQTVDFLGPGRVFGMAEARAGATAFGSGLTTLGYAHVLRIPRSHVPDRVPGTIAGSSLVREEDRERSAPAPDLPPSLLDFLAEHHFGNATAAMMIDLDRCTRCDDCVRACAGTHGHNPRFLRHGPVHERLMVANACLHCQDPVCLRGCPTGAIHREPGDGQIVINDRTCIGCGACATACPYRAIRMVDIHDEQGRPVLATDGSPVRQATKCDLCVGRFGGPACERACPHDALRRIDMRTLREETPWLARASTKPPWITGIAAGIPGSRARKDPGP